MTPLDQVFMISSESELDKNLLKTILKKGYSRIPVFKGERTNILGMLMIKSLLEVDFSEKTFIKDLKLSNIPKFSIEHSLFSIFNEFKQGKSHLGIVETVIDGSKQPVGIITLEDLIEELIQQDILDETDERILDSRALPIQATLQSYLLHGINKNLNSNDQGSVSELLLDNKRA